MSDNEGKAALLEVIFVMLLSILFLAFCTPTPKECRKQCLDNGAVGSSIVRFECVCFYGREPTP